MTATENVGTSSGGVSLIHVYPDQITKNTEELTLRDVDTTTNYFKNLVDSIRTPRTDATGAVVVDHGLLNPIVVRPVAGRPGSYAIVEGLHRLTAWVEAFGKSKPIPAAIQNLSDEQTVIAQLQGNFFKKDTDRVQYAKQACQLLSWHPEWTMADLANSLNADEPWVRTQLSLTKLPDNIQKKVSDGEIPLNVAYGLARFAGGKKGSEEEKTWAEKQGEWLNRYLQIKDQAGSLQQWIGEAATAVKQISKDLKQGKKGADVGANMEVTFTLRKKTEFEVELKRVVQQHDSVTDQVKADVAEIEKNFSDAASAIFQAGYMRALEWAGKVDPDTKAERKAELESRQAEKQQAADEKKAGKAAHTIARSTGKGNLFSMFKK